MFSFAIVVWEMITRKRPIFGGMGAGEDDMAILYAVANGTLCVCVRVCVCACVRVRVCVCAGVHVYVFIMQSNYIKVSFSRCPSPWNQEHTEGHL